MDYIKIEDCCEILDSQRVPITGKDRVAGEYPYYGANGIQGYVDDYIFDEDLVLVAEDGGYFGSKTKPIAYKVSGKCWVNNHAHVLKAKDNVDTDYLCYSLMFYNVDKIVNGATRQKLNQKQLRQMLVPKRTKSKQLEIVRQLKTIDRIIENKSAQLSEYDQLIKSRFVEMFGTPLVNEKKWEVLDANDVCTRITDGSHYSPKDIEKGYPMLSVKDMTNGGFIYDECKHCGANDYAKLRKNDCVPLKNDVLIAKDGSYFYYGFVVKEQKEQAVLSSIAILRPDIQVINPEYLKTYMMSTEIVRLVGEQYVTGAALKRVILKGIRKIPVMLPPINMQNQFSDFIEQVDKLKFVVQKSLDETQKLFDSLMQEYFG